MGAGKTAAIVLDYFKHDTGVSCDFIGYLEDYTPEAKIAAMMPHLGRFEDAEDVIRQTGVQHVMVIAPGLSNDAVQDIVYRVQPLVKKVAFIPDMGNLPLATLDTESLIDGHIVSFSFRNNLALWYNRAVKRIFDVICTSLGIICLSPFFLAIALWIYKDSPGPVIFKHRRVGRNGKEFNCYIRRSQLYLTQALVNDMKCFIDDCASFADEIKMNNELMEKGIFDQQGEVTARPEKMNALWGGRDKITIELKEELKKYEN